MSTPRNTARSYHPPCCPNPDCPYHHTDAEIWPFKRAGFYRRAIPPKRIQRFTCLHCRRSFSRQTFSTTYWQKRPDLDRRIFMKAVGGMALRQIARDIRCSPETVARKVARLGRHCMLLHRAMMESAPAARSIVVDGFETFEWSQYFPFHHNVAVEKETDFFIYFNDSELRRKGRMTDTQRTRRSELERKHGRPDCGAVRKGMADLLDIALAGTDRAVVDSDDHPSYRPAVRQMRKSIEHVVTQGRTHRDRYNRLWEVNLLDLVIRHSSANHKRETIAWSKRRQSSSERLAILLVWRNYMKGRREKQRGSPTPAMARGMLSRRLALDDVLGERMFVGRASLPPRWRDYYWRRVETRALKGQRTHELRYAA